MARNEIRATSGRKAEAISAELCSSLLALTTRRLVDDIRARYRVKRSTAFHAVALARSGTEVFVDRESEKVGM